MNQSSTTATTDTNSPWQAIGAWRGGTVVDVALTTLPGGTKGSQVASLLASRAGAYQWSQADAIVRPLLKGLSDPNVVSVAFAGGDEASPALALAATATGRLFSCQVDEKTGQYQAWQEVPAWAGLGVAVVLAPSPTFTADNILFVGTPTGIFRTLDGGQSWESCNFGLLDEEVLSLICAPNFSTSELLWAGTAGGGLYRSRNSARAWRESGLGLPDAAVQSLAVSPNFEEDRTLYAGMEGYGIYASEDGGENWSYFALEGQSINALACADSKILWAGTDYGLWRIDISTNEATQIAASGEVVMSLSAAPSGEVAFGVLGSGLWLTDDSKRADSIEWQRPLVYLHAPPIVTIAGDELYALDSDGILAYWGDGGNSWSEVAGADPNGTFAIGGAAPLIAATENGVAQWEGKSQSWQPIGDDTLQSQVVMGIDLSPIYAQDKRILVITESSELYLTQDSQIDWQRISGPWQGESLLLAQFSPNDRGGLMAITVKPTQSNHFAITVWHSMDLGAQWEVLASLTSAVPAVVPLWPLDSGEKALFLATQHRIIKLFYQGEPPDLQLHQHFFDESVRVTALAAAPDYGENHQLWAATSAGLYRSTDGAVSWEFIFESPSELPVVKLEATLTHLTTITLGGQLWRADL